MQVHWFANRLSNSIDVASLKTYITNLNDSGYFSILFTYYNALPDIFIKFANAVDRNEKIKFMMAMRARAISPEYLSMLCSGFSQIQKNRLLLNILHGSLSNEESDYGIIDYGNVFSNRLGIIKHTETFLKKIKKNNLFLSSGVEIALAGQQEETLRMAEKYADYYLFDLQGFEKNKNVLSNKIKKMVYFELIVVDSHEFDNTYKDTYDFNEYNLKILTEDELLIFLKDLSEQGVTDVMISSVSDEQDSLVHLAISKNIDKIFAL